MASNSQRVIAAYGLAALTTFLFAGVASSAQGGGIINAVETGADVVLSGPGSLNLAAWSDPLDTGGDFAFINPTCLGGPRRRS
jgi:hypothetical protein